VKFLFDHDVPDDLAYALQASGHEVQFLRAVLPITAPDQDILRLAGARDEVLITCILGQASPFRVFRGSNCPFWVETNPAAKAVLATPTGLKPPEGTRPGRLARFPGGNPATHYKHN